MKTFIQILILGITTSVFGQEIQNLYSEIGRTLDFSPKVQEEWAIRNKALKSLETGEKNWDELSDEEKALFEKYGEVFSDMWDVVGGGCSWYCGANLGKITASSFLSPQGSNNYDPSNVHDLNFKTAWVEGKNGYGIGEFIEFEFEPTQPRINKIIIANGYVKNQIAWKSNSRVKKLKLYIDGEARYILNLKDIPSEQIFNVEPIGHSERSNYDELKTKPNWKIRFEILEIYEGDKYDDVVISEIYFSGLDVHCFAKGTEITMADLTVKPIELLKTGDEILSFNTESQEYESSRIIELANPFHYNLIEIRFKNGVSTIVTSDHPFFDGTNWRSFNPNKTMTDYKFENVLQLNTGTRLKTINGDAEIDEILILNDLQETFTIVQLERNNTFIADGLIVGTEELRVPTMTGHNSR
jgi:hypothetical protein